MSDPPAPEVVAGVAERVWARDESLWGGPGVPEIGNRLGWLDIADRMLADLSTLDGWVDEVHADGLTNTLLLGMGGSSLGPEVLGLSYGGPLGMLDSTDPQAVLDALDPARSCREDDLRRVLEVRRNGRNDVPLQAFL